MKKLTDPFSICSIGKQTAHEAQVPAELLLGAQGFFRILAETGDALGFQWEGRQNIGKLSLVKF